MMKTSHSPKRRRDAWLAVLQMALVAASIALSLFPRTRIPAIVLPFGVAAFANFVLMVREDWKSGTLSKTPGELYAQARAARRFPRQALATAAAVACCIALWHISMG